MAKNDHKISRKKAKKQTKKWWWPGTFKLYGVIGVVGGYMVVNLKITKNKKSSIDDEPRWPSFGWWWCVCVLNFKVVFYDDEKNPERISFVKLTSFVMVKIKNDQF